MSADAIVARARGCLGARFRPQGRDPALGLDCVGLAGVAFAIEALPGGYALRGGEAADVASAILAAGLRPVADACIGDLVLARCGPGQLHLAVLVPGGFVHADAGLGRVVERPGALPWPVLGAWRREET